MSGFDVDPDEMPAFPPLDDAAIEAWLTGRSGAADEIESLALFAEDVGTAMGGPGPSPKPNLALLLAEGFSPDHRPATAQVAPPYRRRTKKMLVSELLAGLAAKLAGLGLAAKVGLGVGLAAASVGGAGAAGVLPGPVQDVVATAVSAVTPFDVPADTNDDIGDDTDDDIGDGIDDETGDDTGAAAGGPSATGDNPNNGIGKAVSADARGESDGVRGVDRQTVSEAARNKNNGNGNGKGDGATTTTTSTTVVGLTNVGPETGTKATGLDRANETPAAGRAPAGVPGPAGGTTGLDRADETPANGRAPVSPGRP